jgi:8-oxo-dGTP pyrophosphatase MutT (NUDIX family)/GNAT superfamily N-acetyltransferase
VATQPELVGANGRRFAGFAAAVLVFIVDPATRRVLLLRSPRRSRGWEIVNGGLEAGETLEEGALREVGEEAGPDVRVELLGVCHASTWHYDDEIPHMLSTFFVARYLGGDVVPGDDMAGSDVWWASVEEIAGVVASGERVVPEEPGMFERAVDCFDRWSVGRDAAAGSSGPSAGGVRRLGPGDEALAEAAVATFAVEEGDGLPVDVAPMLSSPTAVFLVSTAGEGGDDVVPAGWVYGHQLVHPDGERTMLLYALDVDEPYRRQGRGRTLVEAFVREAESQGCTEVWVLTDDANPAALATYAAAGGRREADPSVMFTWRLASGREAGTDQEG